MTSGPAPRHIADPAKQPQPLPDGPAVVVEGRVDGTLSFEVELEDLAVGSYDLLVGGDADQARVLDFRFHGPGDILGVAHGLQARLAMLSRDLRVYGELLAAQRRRDLAGTDREADQGAQELFRERFVEVILRRA